MTIDPFVVALIVLAFLFVGGVIAIIIGKAGSRRSGSARGSGSFFIFSSGDGGGSDCGGGGDS